MSIAAVVLAGGASRRLGRPKQNVVIQGETLLERTVRVARAATLSPIVVATRSSLDLAPRLPDHVVTAVNAEADEGIASSIRCGVAVAAEHRVTGAVLLACDQPALSAEHLTKLIEDPFRLTASSYSDCLGIPAYFPLRFFPSLLSLRGETGARPMLKDAYAIFAPELELDIDTERDLETARALFEGP